MASIITLKRKRHLKHLLHQVFYDWWWGSETKKGTKQAKYWLAKHFTELLETRPSYFFKTNYIEENTAYRWNGCIFGQSISAYRQNKEQFWIDLLIEGKIIRHYATKPNTEDTESQDQQLDQWGLVNVPPLTKQYSTAPCNFKKSSTIKLPTMLYNISCNMKREGTAFQHP